ncbi:porin family protein [Parabacteroides sp. AM08-6]|uniref:porin family protein n=1 Tax=Parabacteroides sp. AM08-6 TaxID=2292053 RepID=UPI000EFFD6BC|nr:porin family protein [Parabacteroides sp. AM08-6]RHJ87633.1 PorT family protein [Parabacteroides sp. AM08-6]
MIKKLFITAIICLIAIAGIQAQNNTFKQELALGASFGMNFSTVSFAQTRVNTKMKLGYNGGLTLRWNTEKNLGLQGELNFTQQGWDEQFDDPQYKYTRTINYIELPIFTHIYFGSKRFKVFVNLGPKIGYAFSESTDENLNGATPNNENTQHGIPVEKKFDWGLCGGPGIELRTGIGYFLLEGRYYYALGDIFNSRNEDYFAKSSNQVISAKITYMLPLFK